MAESTTPASHNSWENAMEAFMARGTVPSYSEVCDLAQTSPALNVAFASENPFRTDHESIRFHIAQDVEIAHGLKPWFAPDVIEHVNQTTFIIDCAEISLVHFEALIECSGRILKAGVPMQTELSDWLAKYLLGEIAKPKPPKGPNKFKNIDRDFCIRLFLSRIETLDYPITENIGTFSGTSACHAISDAWTGRGEVPSVKRLMNIWSER